MVHPPLYWRPSRRLHTIGRLACVALAIAVLAACGAPAAEGPSALPSRPEQGAASPAASQAAANREADAGFNPSGLPIVDQPLTLNIVAQKAGTLTPNFSEMVLFERLQEQTNIVVEWNNIATADYQEKKNLLLASGDLPDAFWNTGFNDNDIVTYGGNGTLIPLEGLIEQYAPNLSRAFQRRPEIKQAVTAPDGHIYTLPFAVEMQDIGATPFFHVINTAWLDKLGLEMPTMLDELHNVLVAFKTQDPNGNGQADEIPFSFIFDWWCADIGDLFGPFGMPDNLEHRIVRDGKVIYTAVQPEYRDALAYFHQWYAEGLIDPESFTQDSKAYLAKGKTEVETLGSYIWWEVEEVVGPERAGDYALVPPLAGPGGDRLVGHANGSPYGRAAFAITRVNQHPEATMRWIDQLYDPYMSAQVIWGPEGVIYERDANNMLVNKPLPEGVSTGEYRQTVAPEGVGVILAEDFGTVVDMEPRAKQRVKDLAEVYRPHMEDEWYPGVFFTPEELEKLSTMETDIDNLVTQQRAKWLVDGGIEAEWDGYVEQLKQMGLDEMIAIYQTALNRYKGSDK